MWNSRAKSFLLTEDFLSCLKRIFLLRVLLHSIAFRIVHYTARRKHVCACDWRQVFGQFVSYCDSSSTSSTHSQMRKYKLKKKNPCTVPFFRVYEREILSLRLLCNWLCFERKALLCTIFNNASFPNAERSFSCKKKKDRKQTLNKKQNSLLVTK